MSAAEPIHRFAQAGRPATYGIPREPDGPNSPEELDALMRERAAAALRAEGQATARRSTPAVSPLSPLPSEQEARQRLSRAIVVRDEAANAVAVSEAAVARARAVEAEAEAAAASSVTTELRGGHDLAQRIAEWARTGGQRPDLGPDAASLDARRDGDRARVHADAARQAARVLADDLAHKRTAAQAADAAVQAAAGEVAAVLVAALAEEGRAAEIAFRRAQLAVSVVHDIQSNPSNPVVRMGAVARKLGAVGLLEQIRETTESGSREEHRTAWANLLTALQSDPAASLGD